MMTSVYPEASVYMFFVALMYTPICFAVLVPMSLTTMHTAFVCEGSILSLQNWPSPNPLVGVLKPSITYACFPFPILFRRVL